MRKTNEYKIDIHRIEPEKESLTERKISYAEIYQPYSATRMQSQAARCIDCGTPFCQWKCPLHNPVPQWLKLAAQGDIIQAAVLCHQENSLPEICGRVCPQEKLCEGACTLQEQLGEAVTIGHIERDITDKAFALGWKPDLQAVVKTNKKVAIIGAGPAGLACADVLIRQGIDVTVYDKHPEIGGLLTFGIPSFKLEKSIMQHRHALFAEMGIQFQLNTDIGKDIALEQLMTDYDAVFLGLGTYQAKKGDLNYSHLQGVYNALPYLTSVTKQHLNSPLAINNPFISFENKKVIILGGGDTAMDCARTAIRQGASDVTCIYHDDKTQLTASTREVQFAVEEGVKFIFNQQPIRFETQHNSHVYGVYCINTIPKTNTAYTTDDKNSADYADIDKNNQRPFISYNETLFTADAIIVAFGFQAEKLAWLDDKWVKRDSQNRIVINEYMQTMTAKIFAGGDIVQGSSLVVTAIAQGRKAAENIISYLQTTV